MTAQALPPVKYRYTDENGIPLTGGKVYTFETDGVTPRNSYSDSSGLLSPNTNPVILDSAGQADIYISGAYFVRVTDSLDNVICEGVVIDSYSAASSVVGDIASDLTTLTARVDSNDASIAAVEDDIVDVNDRIDNSNDAIAALASRVTALEGNTSYQLPINTILEFAEDVSPSTFGSRIGYGTWVVYGVGRVVVGAGTLEIDYSSATGDAARSNESKTFAVGDTDGEFTHKQTTAEMRAHTHKQNTSSSVGDYPQIVYGSSSGGVDGLGNQTDATIYTNKTQVETTSVGSSTPFNVMQPYIVAKRFKRTA